MGLSPLVSHSESSVGVLSKKWLSLFCLGIFMKPVIL